MAGFQGRDDLAPYGWMVVGRDFKGEMTLPLRVVVGMAGFQRRDDLAPTGWFSGGETPPVRF